MDCTNTICITRESQREPPPLACSQNSIALCYSVHANSILEEDDTRGWIVNSGAGRHVCSSRQDFKETKSYRDKEMAFVL